MPNTMKVQPVRSGRTGERSTPAGGSELHGTAGELDTRLAAWIRAWQEAQERREIRHELRAAGLL
jgi:hypothetical protein